MEEEKKENTKKGMFSWALNYSILISMVMIIFSLIFYLAGEIHNNLYSYIGWAVFAGCLVYANLQFRKEAMGGFISYGKSYGFGVYVGLISGFFTAVFTYLLYAFISPELVEEARTVALETIYEKRPDMSEDELELIIAMQQRFTTPITLALSTFFGKIFQAAIFGLIISAFIKKKEPETI